MRGQVIDGLSPAGEAQVATVNCLAHCPLKAWFAVGVLTEKATPNGDTLVRERTGNRSLVVFDSGDEVTVQAGDDGIRFPLVSGETEK